MSIQKDNKLKNLLEQWPSGLVATSVWLKEMSISPQLTQRYVKSGWIESLGRGAYKRINDDVGWVGALVSLKQQLTLNIHVGGPTSFSLQGAAHYLRARKESIFLFTTPNQHLPKWFLNHNWVNPIEIVHTSFLPQNIALSSYELKNLEITVSSPERAILECLYLSPGRFDLVESYQIMEGLTTLRPKVLQTLLVNCSSIRVKRLFLYMAKKAQLPVLEYLNLNQINLGTGDRAIVKQGVYNAEFKISIPKELADYV